MLYRRLVTKRRFAEIDLGRPGLLRLSGAQGARIEGLSGIALITFHDVKTDVELRCGENIIVPNNGLTLLEGFDGCRVRLINSRTDAIGLLATISCDLIQTAPFHQIWLATMRKLRWQ